METTKRVVFGIFGVLSKSVGVKSVFFVLLDLCPKLTERAGKITTTHAQQPVAHGAAHPSRAARVRGAPPSLVRKYMQRYVTVSLSSSPTSTKEQILKQSCFRQKHAACSSSCSLAEFGNPQCISLSPLLSLPLAVPEPPLPLSLSLFHALRTRPEKLAQHDR